MVRMKQVLKVSCFADSGKINFNGLWIIVTFCGTDLLKFSLFYLEL